ncbi:putative peptide transport fused subunits of ABC superfamily: ATP-binding components [uncultured Pleomorphomonas sp.]|uniref:Putative peptide transport fused subunits of ABC superfamily: ATP-binding components n=1 Tax=uncultured Pleomorphomonas sp. TaxID=442121 RepID=A0A212LFX7_9HYPH|nr:ABC transporter ATP-binding protein [uncultured Pleomorphomonas sp.]SCM76398.1 putative peptide transport fused subunits of ABC superfamily: ATP-binding components [uncultured Pleomorphomonas sp.]
MTAPLIAVDDLTIDYGRQPAACHRAVDGVSFDIRLGEVLGLAGESGSGKSTVAYALLARRRPGSRVVSGRILFEGEDILPLPERQVRLLRGGRIGFVPQNPATSLTPSMPVGRQIVETIEIHGVARGAAARRLAEDLLVRVHLPEPQALARRYPHQLSGGQQQRVLIAMALACRPRLLVLDEPTTGLDVTTQAQILTLLADIRAEFATAMLYVSHDLAALGRLADRIAVMKDGRLVEIGPTASIVGSPRQPYTRVLLAALPDLDRPPAGVADDAAKRNGGEGKPLLEVDGLVAAYRGEGLSAIWRRPPPTVRDVSFSIRRGETFALIGESGSGKSTIARAILGLTPDRRGGVRFDGRDLPADARRWQGEWRRRIQIVFQNPDASLNPRHSVAAILGRPLERFFGLRGRDRRLRAAELLESVRLDPAFLDRRPDQLSGGQRQRVAIARALAAEPEVLICDEVLSALDVSVQAEILALLRTLQAERHLTYLFISHDLAVVRWFAQSVGVLHRGEFCALGPVEEVFSPPHHPYTARLLAAVPRIPAPDDNAGRPAKAWFGEPARASSTV